MADIFALFRLIERNKPEKKPVSFIIAGLGNPGEEYRTTRHNAGFLCADLLAAKLGAQKYRIKFKALCAECECGGTRVLVMKPQTFMNLSGEAVREAMDFYKLPPEKLLVICDDVNFDAGEMRIRKSGSDAGQKGMRSIIEQLSSDAFPRIRLGVGRKPTPEYDLSDWVLSKFTPDEQKLIYARLDDACEAARLIVSGDIETAMSRFNSRKKQD